ncbi:sugar transferase [Sphingomonas bacterium]|uniref:sugar transferase n=1 Tax=Sphingomonas bacterium TaxID=1895847 RepID=UPI0020C72FDA|nr:sugar transferase [Sphingomonas bacterium]
MLRVRSVLYLLGHDCFAIAISFVAAAAVQRGVSFHDRWLTTASALLPIYVLIAFTLRAYAPAMLQDPFDAIRRGGKALLASLGTLLVIAFYLKSSTRFSRLEFAEASASAIVLLSMGRYLFVRHLAAIVGGNPFSSILILDGDEPRPTGDFSVVMTAETCFNPDEQDPVMYDRLARSLESADRVVIACPCDRREAWTRALRGANIQGEIAIPELAALSPLGLGRGGTPSVIVATGPLSLMDRCIKRLFDVTLAGGVLLGLAPLLALVALWVRLDSPGSILFRQIRIGRGNQMFKVLKFRSMYADGSDGAGHRSASRNDDRITRCGRILRKTSIDELPQLLNVLKGDMSIVGPRPHALGSRAADKLFWEVDHRYWDRHATKPGLTGLAQVRGFRGATLVEDDLRNRLRADLEYLENWSIWRDLKIIFLTVKVVFHRNAF